MRNGIRNLDAIRAHWIVYGVVEDGDIVVRARPRNCNDRGAEITRLNWKTHIYRPADPLHPDILRMIAERMADLVGAALQSGQRHAQLDIQKALGL